MKKIIIATSAFILVAIIVVLALYFPPVRSAPVADYGPPLLRGTIVHTGQIEEGYLVYVSSPERSDLLYIFLITEESEVEQKLMNVIHYGFSGDYVEIVANTETDFIAGQYVRVIETMDLYTVE